jgi:SPP1 gp7 family putative phage head morphogenesis protein
MPINLSAETKPDPTRAKTITDKYEDTAVALVRSILAELKRAVHEQGFLNAPNVAAMSPNQFLKYIDTLVNSRVKRDTSWLGDMSVKAYGQGRVFSSVVLGAPIEVRERIWKKTGTLIERSTRSFSKMTDNMSADVRRIVADGILKERSQGDIVKEINDLTDTYDYQARRIVRTETMEAVNTGVMDGYRADEVEKVEWLAAEGCCDRCQALDGKVFDINSGVSAPLHPNCRCTLIPVIDIPGREPRQSEGWTEDEE